MHSSDIYERAFRNARAGLFLADSTNGCVLHANAAFARMIGYESEEVLGCPFWKPPLMGQADLGAEVFQHIMAGGFIECVQWPLQARDGRWLVLEVSARPLGDVIQFEVEDVTAREQARLSARNELLGSLARRTATEFADLQRTLRNMGSMLLAGGGRPKAASREMDEIRQIGERAGTIAAQLRAFSGASACDLRPVALNDVIESLMPRLRNLFGRQIEILTDLIPDLAPVRADPALLRQIVLHLATNSKEALVTRGTFCLQTRHATSLEPGLGRSVSNADSFAVLAVSDDGPGLTDDIWERLYEPFVTTKAHQGNLGLGLAAVYGLVRQIGGRLWAYSEIEKGTLFRIYLPYDHSHLPAPTSVSTGNNATILLIDPHDGLRFAMANSLKTDGYRVLAARHSQEAWHLAKVHGPPDLLIAGPEPELIEYLERRKPRLRILLVGGYGDELAAKAASLPPGTSLLRKPFAPDKLLAQVRLLLSDGPL